MDENKNLSEEHSAATPAASDAPVVVKEKKDRLLPASILIAAVLIAGSVVFGTLYKNNGTAAVPPADNGAPTNAPDAITKLGARDAVLGNANAPITLIEYGDYQCPFCAQFFSQVEPQI